MTSLSLESSEFYAIVARGFNQVPLIARARIDGLTPTQLIGARDGSDGILLESSRQLGQDGRYSFAISSPLHTFRAKGMQFAGDGAENKGHPMAELRAAMKRFRGYRPEGAPLFCGGAIGYLAYECNRYFESVPTNANDDLAIDDLAFWVVDTFVAFDHESGNLLFIASGNDYEACKTRIEGLADWVARARAIKRPAPRTVREGHLCAFESNFEKAAYEKTVRDVQEHIRAGDVYQVNLSQRLNVAIDADGLALYETLCQVSPVPFASYMRFGNVEIVSASPERLVRLDGRSLKTRPIAGTRRRGTPEEDAEFVRELLHDEKEVSEHAMLVDLARNDLGRVSTYGSVHVTKPFQVTHYAHVIHVESEVEGNLSDGMNAHDVIAATFPGGTITGVPKVRTMELLCELEPSTRGIYTGSIGYLSFAGDMDLNIVIRTMLIRNGHAYVHVGGGIVWDSIPEREYKETLNKARSLRTVLAAHGAR
jgi:para-aminobenzoate synthetase component 1